MMMTMTTAEMLLPGAAGSPRSAFSKALLPANKKAGRSRQVSALDLYGEGREVLRSAGRLFDRSDREGRTDHEGRRPSRCPIAERGDGQGEDFFERGGREGAWGRRGLPRRGGGSQLEGWPR